MKHPYRTCAAAVVLISVIARSAPLVSAQLSTKAYALPGAATDATSIVSNVPNFMVTIAEGGTVLGEAKATCDNRVEPDGKAGLQLQHYFAKDTFEQMAGVLRPFALKQEVQKEAGAAAVVSETLDGAEAAYFVVTRVCDIDIGTRPVNPSTSRIVYQARLFRDTTYATFEVSMSAVSPDIPRKYVREMMQKIGALNYADVK